MKKGVSIVLLKKDGKLLLQHRDNISNIANPNYWGLPGGSVEGKESFEEAAKRELKEETGYDLKEIYPLVDWVSTDSVNPEVYVHIFWAWYDDIQPIQCFEGQAMEFIPKDQLDSLQIHEHHYQACRMALEKAFQNN